MTKVLLTTYDGFPSADTGGPNKVIHQIIEHTKDLNVQYDLLTYKYLVRSPAIIQPDKRNMPLKRTIADYLFKKYKLYRKITTSDSYLERHYHKRDIFFNKMAEITEYNVIHSHTSLSHYHFINSNAKKILTVHSKGSILNDMEDYINKISFFQKFSDEFRKREILAFNNSDVITFPSEYAYELFYSDYGGELDKSKHIEIIHNGVDTKYIDSIKADSAILKRYGICDNYDVLILNVANHVMQKNIDKILDIISLMVDRGIKPLLINIGTGVLTASLKEKIASLKLIKNVKLLGKVSHNEVLKFMKICDALIMLSDRIVFDMVILEAIACSMHIISNLEGGNREVLSNYKGYVDISCFIKDFKIPDYRPAVINSFGINQFDIQRTVTLYKNLYYG
jgi:glycosyltransferase involved in cell wall biosynthesis